MREWLEQWVEDGGILKVRLEKVGLALKLSLTPSMGEEESLKGVRLGSGIKKKGLFPVLCSVPLSRL